MRIGDARRLLLWAILVAVVLGLLFGWYAHIWTEPTPESRLRETAEGIKERVRKATH